MMRINYSKHASEKTKTDCDAILQFIYLLITNLLSVEKTKVLLTRRITYNV